MTDELTPGGRAEELNDRPAVEAGAMEAGAPGSSSPGRAGGSTGEDAEPGAPVAGARFEPLERAGIGSSDGENLELIMDLELEISIELGRTRMKVKDVLSLGVGAIIELDKVIGEPMEIYANDRVIARGEVVVVDEDFGIRVTEIVKKDEAGEAKA